VIEIVKRETVL